MCDPVLWTLALAAAFSGLVYMKKESEGCKEGKKRMIPAENLLFNTAGMKGSASGKPGPALPARSGR